MKKKVYAYLHTHWDREWYRDKEDFNLRFLEVFDVVLDELKKNRAPFFYMDGQIIAVLDYLKYRPERKKEIIKLIKAKKLAIGPYFVSADSYLVSFCAMLKNLDYGMALSKQFSQKNYIGYMSDIFGISKSAFSALKLKNIDKALIWRGVNPKKIKNNANFLYDNIQTTWLTKGYFNDFFHQDSPNIEGIKKYLDDISKFSSKNCLLPIGADHLGILKNAKAKIKYVNSKLENYEIILTNPFEYFKRTNFENKFANIEFLDNSDTYTLNGVYSTRIYQKIKNVEIENKLSRIIEPLNYYLKDKYRANIDNIWQTLIKNHAHDGIYGCSIDDTQKSVDSRFHKCNLALRALEKRLIGNFKIQNNIKNKSDKKLGLFNLSNTDNIKTVELNLPYVLKNSQVIDTKEGFCDELLYDIYKIPVTEDITPIYRQLVEVSYNNKFEFNTVEITKPKKEVKITEKSIENKNIKLEIKNNKIYISNKNQIQELKLTDIKDKGDSYNFAPFHNGKTFKLKKSEILYEGNIECALRLDFSDIIIDVILDNKSKFLRFNYKINNKNKNHKIQMVLLFNKPITKTTAQDAIGTIDRKIDPNYKMQDFMPAKRPVELKTNSFPMQNFVCTQNTCILTKGQHEYEIYNNEMRICLLRCTGTVSNPKNPARSIPAGPDLKTFDSQCLGEQKGEFAIIFGNKKDAFLNLDLFFKNYVALDGDFEKEINKKLDTIPDNSYIYGMSKNKKISYNFMSDTISLI